MMVFLAAQEMDIDLSKSYFVGDQPTDVECGTNAGLKTVSINYKNDEEIITLLKDNKPSFIIDDFLQACDFIITDYNGDKTF